MKKTITIRLCTVILIAMSLTILLAAALQVDLAKDSMEENSDLRIQQISQIIDENEKDIGLLQENLKEDYIIRAKAAAYIVQNKPEVVRDQDELDKIIALLQVDELHFFDKEGRLYAGSVPKYFDYTFHSGPQMSFFLPMLDDYSLELSQDVQPNTAEEKLMQYTAVWREDHEAIVQIGIEPRRVMEAMARNELTYIFSLMKTDGDICLYAVNAETGVIEASTNDAFNGKRAEETGLILNEDNISKQGFTATLNGEKSYCVFRRHGERYLGVSKSYNTLFESIPKNMGLIVLAEILIGVVAILLILRLIDRFIIEGIDNISCSMSKITCGNLDARVEEYRTPEFTELSDNINFMVKSLLDNTGRLSMIFQYVDVPVAVFECNRDMKRVLATSKLSEILDLGEEEAEQLLADQKLFREKLSGLESSPLESGEDIYCFRTDRGIKYIRIKFYQEEKSSWGVLMDVTKETLERQKLERERDIDVLTQIYSRRALFSQLDRLFRRPDKLGRAVLLMADVDNLKYINDNFGHDWGDVLLKRAAGLLMSCKAPQKVPARLGGDEFILFCYGEEDQDTLQKYIDELYGEMRRTSITLEDGKEFPVSMSGGYIFYPEDAIDYSELIRLADRAMYRAKRERKGCFARYEV